jgi:hypothetical protein
MQFLHLTVFYEDFPNGAGQRMVHPANFEVSGGFP